MVNVLGTKKFYLNQLVKVVDSSSKFHNLIGIVKVIHPIPKVVGLALPGVDDLMGFAFDEVEILPVG